MHSSVLQNEDYIKFADDSTVEVLALQRLDEAIQKKDPKAGTYEAKDEKGATVQYMKSWPGLTFDQIQALNTSPAGQYNQSGGIPYTSLVNPHTLKEMRALPGGTSSQQIMDAVALAQKTLGAPLKRSTLRKFEKSAGEVEATLEKSGPAKALQEFRKLEPSVAKEGEGLKARAKVLEEKLLAAAKTALDDAEAKIEAGEVKAAKDTLGPLAKALKGTDLHARANELLEKCKAPAPE